MPDPHEERRPLPARFPHSVEKRYPTPPYDVFGYPGEPEDSIHLRDYWRVLVFRRWTVLAVLATVVAVAAVATFKQVPVYRASARLQIDRENPNILAFQDVYEIESTTDDALETQFQILEARSLARRVVEEMRLTEHPEFQPVEPGAIQIAFQSILNVFAPNEATPSPPGETERLRATIDTYLDRLTVSPVRQSRLVDVSFESPDPEFARRVINAHAEHFIDQNFQFRFDATQEASEFLSGQLEKLQFNLETAEDRLQAYGVANDILFTGDGLNTAMAKLQQLETEYTKAQSDRIQAESYNRLIQSGQVDALPQLLDNALISDLSSDLAGLEQEDADLAVTFQPDYPRRQRVRGRIDEIRRTIGNERQRIVSTLQVQYDAALRREELLRDTVDQQLNVVNELNAELIQYNILKRQADSNQQLYDGLLTRLREAEVAVGLRASNIRIVDRAETPSSPVRPRRALNLALALMAGLSFGVGLAFFQEYMDNSIKSAGDVARHLGLPTMATVPRRATRGGNGSYGDLAAEVDPGTSIEHADFPIERISADAPNSIMAEAYRSLRTSLLLSSADHPPRTVLVTSAVPGEGKTVTAINLAVSLTQTGSRVVVVDADMRKPRVHSVFALGATPGLSGVLTGNAGIKEVLHQVSIPNLFVLPCGVIPPNPAELLMSTRFERMLSSFAEYFDYVILDSPPVSNVSDARILCRQSDSTLMVVKAGSTPRHVVERALGNLHEAHGRITGVVLNDLNRRVKAYDSYYSEYSGQYYAANS